MERKIGIVKKKGIKKSRGVSSRKKMKLFLTFFDFLKKGSVGKEFRQV